MEIGLRHLFNNHVFYTKALVIGMMSIFIFSSCNFNKNVNPLFGNWYGFEQDSTYYELYVNDTLIVLHHHNIGPIGYDYQIDENHLVVSNEAGMERVWQVLDESKDAFTLRDSLEYIRYIRLDLSEDFFKSIQDSISYQEFKKGYLKRFSDRNKAK